MTRCLDCGSERIADQCPSCGLTSAAAEVMFRRRLLKRTAVFLVGSLAFPYVSQIYPPLDLDLMLVFFGVIFSMGLTIAVILDRRAQNRAASREFRRLRSISRRRFGGGGGQTRRARCSVVFRGLSPVKRVLSFRKFST